MRKSVVLLSCLALIGLAVFGLSPEAFAGDMHHRAGEVAKQLGVLWVVPFAGMLLSIAVAPLVAPNFWNNHYGKAAAFWGLAFLVPFAFAYGFDLALYTALETLFLDYLSFIVLLFSLFTITGGIYLSGSLAGTPKVNAGIILIGTLLASWMGTTGAAVLFIRPLMRSIAHRKYKVHTIVFFIFLVANSGGSLTPLGDPPLFLGFLRGVDFFWTLTHMFPLFLFLSVILLTLYFIIDTMLYNKEGRPESPDTGGEKLSVEGGKNLLLLAGVLGGVIMSGMWKPDSGVTIYHVHIELQNIARDVLLLALAYTSMKITPNEIRRKNEFEWEPIREVAKLFAGIFASMIPAIRILGAGTEGALSNIISLVRDSSGADIPAMYFWLSGILSSFLDNAPTYLVFFSTAGGFAEGGPERLMTEGAATLTAIAAGAVFMGANTYIGNAPNFMIRSIAETGGIKMPSFFGYMGWSAAILIPCFIVMTFIFF
jgi:Na+/H+ antiporter NhaD/arsenite permease-like protein